MRPSVENARVVSVWSPARSRAVSHRAVRPELNSYGASTSPAAGSRKRSVDAAHLVWLA